MSSGKPSKRLPKRLRAYFDSLVPENAPAPVQSMCRALAEVGKFDLEVAIMFAKMKKKPRYLLNPLDMAVNRAYRDAVSDLCEQVAELQRDFESELLPYCGGEVLKVISVLGSCLDSCNQWGEPTSLLRYLKAGSRDDVESIWFERQAAEITAERGEAGYEAWYRSGDWVPRPKTPLPRQR